MIWYEYCVFYAHVGMDNIIKRVLGIVYEVVNPS